tara:strand:+ start:387 stop:593 length:207 start_codon:yes stop_codon:yes gene_type:complete
MSAFTFSEVHKSEIRAGDTISHNGKIMTVGKRDLTYCDFFVIEIFGDSYKLGYQSVLKAAYNDPITAS